MISPLAIFLRLAVAAALSGIILAVLKPLEHRLTGKRSRRPRVVATLSGINALAACETALADQHLPFSKTVLRRQPDGDDRVTTLFAKPVRREQLAALADAMRGVEGITSVTYEG